MYEVDSMYPRYIAFSLLLFKHLLFATKTAKFLTEIQNAFSASPESQIIRSRASLVAQMVKNLPVNVGDLSSIPGSGRTPGEGVVPLQYGCLENSKDRGAWQGTVHGVAKESDMTE